MILEEKQPCFVSAVKGKAEKHGKAEMVSALQLKKGLKRGQETYLAALVEIHEGHDAEVPDSVAGILRNSKTSCPPSCLPEDPLITRSNCCQGPNLLPKSLTGWPLQNCWN